MEGSPESDLVGVDYYALLNVAHNASDLEIRNAYRHLSKMFHPDKHHNPDRKREAEILFSKVKQAYEVLTNPQKRAIFDSVGEKGLATQGWEIAHCSKTPNEIREEYERIAREQEQLYLLSRTNPKSAMLATFDFTELFNPSEEVVFRDIRDYFGLPHIEMNGLRITQYIEAPLTPLCSARLEGMVKARNGKGFGEMGCTLHYILSDTSWMQGKLSLDNQSLFKIAGKYFTRFGGSYFLNSNLAMNIKYNSVSLGVINVLSCQLDERTNCSLQWTLGTESALITSLFKEAERYNASLNFYCSPHNAYTSLNYEHKFQNKRNFHLFLKVGNMWGVLEYGGGTKITEQSQLNANLIVSIPGGVQLKLKLKRGEQTYGVTLLLCDEVLMPPVLYGTMLPMIGWAVLDRLVVKPMRERQRKERIRKERESNRTLLEQGRQEAQASIELMQETYRRALRAEEDRKGLVIVSAVYSPVEGVEGELECQEVTVPLQCLVQESKLMLQDTPKHQLPGFFDPCPGEDKTLCVKYLFHTVLHQVTITDREFLRMPLQSHRMDK